MTSQSSTNKNSISLRSLMQEDLRHKTWMIALSILGSFLAGPVAMLLFFSDRMVDRLQRYFVIVGDQVFNPQGEFLMTLDQYYRTLANQATDYFSHYYTILMVIIAYLGAMIVAFFGFRFLYHKRMVDLYHSAPVSRRKLFTAYWLNGILIWFVPALASSLLVLVIAGIYTRGMYLGTLLVNLLLALLRLTLCYLMVYHVCLVGVMLSGNVINAIVNGLSIGALVFACTVTVLVLMETFFDNFYLPDHLMFMNPLYAFSPLVSPILLVTQWVTQSFESGIVIWHLLSGIVLMLLNLVLAYLLYVRRPSELSERGLENKCLRVILRSGICVVGGIGFAMIFHAALGRQRLGWILFGMVLGSALSFCVLNIIYHCTFKEVFSHKLNYIIVLGLCALFYFGGMFDLIGYDARLPKQASITGLSLFAGRFTDSDYLYYLSSAPNSFYDVNGSEPLAYTSRDRESIYKLLSACTGDSDGFGEALHIRVKVTTKTGSFYRSYRLSMEDYSLLAPFVESKEYAEVYYPVRSLVTGMPREITLSSSFDRDSTIKDPSKIRELMQAFHQDFEEHRSIQELLRTSRLFTLYMSFTLPAKDSSEYRNTFHYDVPYWYHHTISLIESWYPDKQWDPAIEDIERFTIKSGVAMTDDKNLHRLIYQSYGFEESGAPLATPAPRPSRFIASTTESCSWSFPAASTDFLKGLEPYLIWGHYNNPLTCDYVHLGYAQLKDGGSVDCYIQAGKLPLDILKEIEEAAAKTLELRESDKYDMDPEYAIYQDGYTDYEFYPEESIPYSEY